MQSKLARDKADVSIRGAFLEIAAQLNWGVRSKDLTDLYWNSIPDTLQKVELARQRYLEGEYQLAIETLPEF
jgi:hypothetical protein